MAEDPFKAMNLSRREYLSKYGQSVIDSPNSNISDREDALVVKEGLSNQRGREAQQQFYDVAPNAREAFLEDNAVISASPQFGQVQGYMGEVRRGPTYADNVLRKSIAAQVPAYLRGEYNARVDAGEGVNEVFADLEIKDEDRNLRLKGISAGISPVEMDKFRNPETGLHDVEAVQYEISQRKRTPASGTSPQMKAMEDEYEFLRQSVKDMKEEYGGLAPPTGENPEYDAAVLQMRGLGARMSAARSSVFNPPVKEKIDTTADWAAADAAEVGLAGTLFSPENSLKQNLAKAAGGGVFPELTVADEKKLIASNVDNLGGLSGLMRNPKISIESKREVLDRLKELVPVAKPPVNSTYSEVAMFREANKKLLEDAEAEVLSNPTRVEWGKAWSEVKGGFSDAVSKMSKDLGVDESVVIASVSRKPGEGGGTPDLVPFNLIPERMRPSRPAAGVYAKDLFAKYVAEEEGRNPKEVGWENELEDRVETRVSQWDKKKGLTAVEREAIFRIGASGRYTKLQALEEYLKENKPSVASAPAALPTASAPKAAPNIKRMVVLP